MPVALDPKTVPEAGGTIYPEPYKAVVDGRFKRKLGDAFGLTNFGVNLTRLEPGAASALRHWHTKQDEFVYMLEGELALYTDAGREVLKPGMVVGFKAGVPDGHRLVNESQTTAVFLEIGDRTPDDGARYPEADLQLDYVGGERRLTHKDGRPW